MHRKLGRKLKWLVRNHSAMEFVRVMVCGDNMMAFGVLGRLKINRLANALHLWLG